MLQSCGCRMFPFLSDLLRWFGQGLPTTAVRPTGGFQVTRRRSGNSFGEGLLDPPFG